MVALIAGPVAAAVAGPGAAAAGTTVSNAAVAAAIASTPVALGLLALGASPVDGGVDDDGTAATHPSQGEVVSGVASLLGASAADAAVLASRALFVPRGADMKWNCWMQLLVSPTSSPDAEGKRMTIASLVEMGVIAELSGTSVVGQDGRRFHLCPVFCGQGGADGCPLELVGMHAVPADM